MHIHQFYHVLNFFLQVITKDTPTPATKSSKLPAVAAQINSAEVQLRRGLTSRASANKSTNSQNNLKKTCRVLFSYQPQHDDELELKLEDVVDFISEVKFEILL